MAFLPKEVQEAWDAREKKVVFTTVSPQGIPNSIYVTCINKDDDDTIVIADNYFEKTLSNIKAGSRSSVLFITEEGTSYQLKGTIEYTTEGGYYDFMKEWNPSKHPGRAAVIISVDEVYSGSNKLI